MFFCLKTSPLLGGRSARKLCSSVLVSGKIYLFILENRNCTNNTNRRSRKSILAGCYLLLIAYELHEYHPDGIRVIRLWLRNIHPAWRLTCATCGSCYSWNSCSLKHRNSRFFRLNVYEGACMSTTIHQTKSYLYIPDCNNFESIYSGW